MELLESATPEMTPMFAGLPRLEPPRALRQTTGAKIEDQFIGNTYGNCLRVIASHIMKRPYGLAAPAVASVLIFTTSVGAVTFTGAFQLVKLISPDPSAAPLLTCTG